MMTATRTFPGTLFFMGTASFASDAILIHGHIYSGNKKMPWAQALALTGSRIDAVGDYREISSHRDRKTKVIDLQECAHPHSGNFRCPHAHVVWRTGAVRVQFRDFRASHHSEAVQWCATALELSRLHASASSTKSGIVAKNREWASVGPWLI